MNALHLGLLLAAFWVAVLGYRGAHPGRFLLALALGAVLSRLGWLLLHGPQLGLGARIALDPSSGLTVLFFPLGPLLLAREDAAAWRSLPAAVAVARIGCLLSGCCGGVPAPWGSHPAVLYELGAMGGLHFWLRRERDERAAPCFLTFFGGVRLLTHPLRVRPPLGPPAVSPALLAGSWLVVALLWSAWTAGAPASSGPSAARARGIPRPARRRRQVRRGIFGVVVVAGAALAVTALDARARVAASPPPRGSIESQAVSPIARVRTGLQSADPARFRIAVASLAGDPSPRARAVLLGALSAAGSDTFRRLLLRRAWASSFVLGLGDRAPAVALAVLADRGVDPRLRALHLLAHHLSAPWDRARYRSYLRHPGASLRSAALEVNGRLWDADALPVLMALESDPNAFVACSARRLVRRYLVWGAQRPTPLERRQANVAFEPDDRQGLRSFRLREAARARAC